MNWKLQKINHKLFCSTINLQKKMQEMKCLLLLCAVLLFGNISCAILQGIIQVKSPPFLAFYKYKTNSSQTLTVQVFQLSLDHENRPILPSVDYLYKTKPISSISQSISLPQQTTVSFQISSLSKNTYYSLFAYIVLLLRTHSFTMAW